ncbi:hypothetical protein HKI87_01g09510 [Chloropicon roscoffensis]|uniref:Uncharacterized protein n=1 Tax=Chloropicon roscoffensis TaxID=1461544 RepID=A0AAX4NZ88_9CHLO|mmetsp:Transcript_1572/g.4937  ORF Transcript_1572/g.4937 Transcript_1572/m.4937 type:complete len:206 (+) Transcript_1572:225-842(+)
MIPVCATTLSSFVWEDSIAPSVGCTLKKNKEGKETRQGSKEAQAAKAFGASAFRAKRQRQNTGFVGKAGFFGDVVHVGQVRVSTVVFVLCLLEAILWTSCLLSSSSALKTDALETEHYLVRETENLKSSLTCKSCDKLVRSLPLQRSSETKQHLILEKRWAQRLSTVYSDFHFDWNVPLRENFQLEASILDKGIPGPFAGVQAIH